MAFGSVLAMGLPLITALIGVGIGISGIGILSAFTNLSSSAPILATMIGLAVGIDYALFIVTRHRQNLQAGLSVEESAARANATAGGAVVFAGTTVVIALASLAVVGIPFLTAMGVAAAGTVAIAVAIAVTLMPALLGALGHHIDRFKVPGLNAHTGTGPDAHRTLSARWARNVTSRPGVALAAGVALMAVLAVPLLGLRLGMTDAGSDPPALHRRAKPTTCSEPLASGPGFNGPLTLLVDLTHSTDQQAALTKLTNAVRADTDIVTVSPAALNPTGDTAVLTAVPASGPSSSATVSLVGRLRHHTIPAVESATGTVVRVTGETAANIDVTNKIAHALPEFMAMVIGLTMVLLLVGFRSSLRTDQSLAVRHLAVDRRRLRRGRRHLPVGLAQGRHRPQTDPAHYQLPADDDVRHPLRALDGLRGVHPVPHPRGLHPHWRGSLGRPQRTHRQRPGDYRRCPHHDQRVRQLRARQRRHHQDVRRRTSLSPCSSTPPSCAW